MKQNLSLLFARNFLAAFAVLLLLKIGLILNNILGTEAFASGANLTAKFFLIIGVDIFGAACLSLLICLLSFPFIYRAGKSSTKNSKPCEAPRLGPTVNGISLGVQVIHASFSAVSFFTTIYVGGPLNREVLELASLTGSEESGDAAPAMWSSINHYLGVFPIAVIIVVIGVAAAIYIFYPRIIQRLGARTRILITVILAGEMFVTMLLLPWLINGHLAGIRVHTYGLEKSAGVEITHSYIKPLFAGFMRGEVLLADDFFYDFKRDTTSEEPPSNPLRGASPSETNLIVVSLESVSTCYIEDEVNPMKFLKSRGSTEGSVLFSNHYSVWPQTMKAFFSLFCSELPYPYYRSITATNPSIPCVSLSEALHDNGYYNAFITSADLAYDRKRRFFNHRSFDMFMDMRDMPGRETIWSDSWGLDERLAVKQILDLAEKKRDEKFFVFYEMFTAHHPYNACQEHVDNPIDDEFKSYKRALKYIDERLEDLTKGLDDLGLLDNTLIAFVADHGEGFGQHPGSRGHGSKIYQENIHVPFAVMGPQLKGIKGEVALPTSHIDVAPTLLGLLGIDIPCTMKGRSLAATSEERLVLFGGRPPGAQMGLIDGKLKYIIEDSGEEFIFNVDSDPHEKNNLIKDNENRAEGYREKIDEWRVFSENLVENYSTIKASSICAERNFDDVQ